MGRLSRTPLLNIKNKSHSVTAEIVVPANRRRRSHHRQGANIGGWRLYANNGKLKYCYNLGGVKWFYVESDKAIPRASIRRGWNSRMTAAGSARGER